MESYESGNGMKMLHVYIHNSRVFHEMPDNWYTKTVMRFKNQQEIMSQMLMNIN